MNEGIKSLLISAVIVFGMMGVLIYLGVRKEVSIERYALIENRYEIFEHRVRELICESLEDGKLTDWEYRKILKLKDKIDKEYSRSKITSKCKGN